MRPHYVSLNEERWKGGKYLYPKYTFMFLGCLVLKQQFVSGQTMWCMDFLKSLKGIVLESWFLVFILLWYWYASGDVKCVPQCGQSLFSYCLWIRVCDVTLAFPSPCISVCDDCWVSSVLAFISLWELGFSLILCLTCLVSGDRSKRFLLFFLIITSHKDGA